MRRAAKIALFSVGAVVLSVVVLPKEVFVSRSSIKVTPKQNTQKILFWNTSLKNVTFELLPGCGCLTASPSKFELSGLAGFPVMITADVQQLPESGAKYLYFKTSAKEKPIIAVRVARNQT